MQKWEYLRLEISYPDRVYLAYSVNGKHLGEPVRKTDASGFFKSSFMDWGNQPRLDDYLQYLGEEGWELVAAPFSVSQFLFKRPKQ